MIEVVSTVGWEELEERVRQTTLLEPRDGQVVYPYAEADIRLDYINYDSVLPTSLYVLRSNLHFQDGLRSDLSMAGHDPWDLEGGLVLRKEDGGSIGLVPPIVEETPAEGKYVLDGAHRTSIGRWIGRAGFVAIHVSDIRPDCPGYAYPNNWENVRITDAVPAKPSDKKHYRGDGYRALYRDFGPLNGSELRT